MCLAPGAGRATPKDEAMVLSLESILQECGQHFKRQEEFDSIQKAKEDISGTGLLFAWDVKS